MRFAGESCVTARMNLVNFERPIPVGETAVVQAYVSEAGETSVRVRLEAFREDLLPANGNRRPNRSPSTSQWTTTSGRPLFLL